MCSFPSNLAWMGLVLFESIQFCILLGMNRSPCLLAWPGFSHGGAVVSFLLTFCLFTSAILSRRVSEVLSNLCSMSLSWHMADVPGVGLWRKVWVVNLGLWVLGSPLFGLPSPACVLAIWSYPVEICFFNLSSFVRGFTCVSPVDCLDLGFLVAFSDEMILVSLWLEGILVGIWVFFNTGFMLLPVSCLNDSVSWFLLSWVVGLLCFIFLRLNLEYGSLVVLDEKVISDFWV